MRSNTSIFIEFCSSPIFPFFALHPLQLFLSTLHLINPPLLPSQPCYRPFPNHKDCHIPNHNTKTFHLNSSQQHNKQKLLWNFPSCTLSCTILVSTLFDIDHERFFINISTTFPAETAHFLTCDINSIFQPSTGPPAQQTPHNNK